MIEAGRTGLVSLKSALKSALMAGERLSPLHPRAYPLKGWWRGGVSLERPDPEGWPLPVGAGVIEASDGYRFGPENLTLAWALEGEEARCVIDLGAGSGSLGLIALYTVGARQLISVERQEAQAHRLRRTLKAFTLANAPSKRLEVCQADLRSPEALSELLARTPQREGADLIVLNPPFFPAGWGRESGSPEVHASTHALHGDVSDFLCAAGRLLSAQGRVCVLYDASRIADLLPALSLARLSIQALKYSPDAREGKTHVPFRVWLIAGRQGAPVTPLLNPASLGSSRTGGER